MQLCSWIFELCSSCAVVFSWIFQIISVQLYFKIQIAVKNCSNYPPSNSPNFTDYPPLPNRPEKLLQLPPARIHRTWIHRTLPTTPLPNRPEKLLQLSPLEFTELYRLPPFQIALKNCSNYPPRIHRTLPTTPLPNRPEKLLQLPPSNSPNFTDYPPSKSPWKTAPTTPPRSNSPNFTDYPPPLANISPVEFTGLCTAGKILRITPGLHEAWWFRRHDFYFIFVSVEDFSMAEEVTVIFRSNQTKWIRLVTLYETCDDNCHHAMMATVTMQWWQLSQCNDDNCHHAMMTTVTMQWRQLSPCNDDNCHHAMTTTVTMQWWQLSQCNDDNGQCNDDNCHHAMTITVTMQCWPLSPCNDDNCHYAIMTTVTRMTVIWIYNNILSVNQ